MFTGWNWRCCWSSGIIKHQPSKWHASYGVEDVSLHSQLIEGAEGPWSRPWVPSVVKGTWWLPHVARALETFIKPGKDDHGQFTAVYCHMDHLAEFSANTDIAGWAIKVLWQLPASVGPDLCSSPVLSSVCPCRYLRGRGLIRVKGSTWPVSEPNESWQSQPACSLSFDLVPSGAALLFGWLQPGY